MTVELSDEFTAAQIEVIRPFAAQIEAILPFIRQVNAGGDYRRTMVAAVRELVKIGTPPDLMAEVMLFMVRIAIDKRIEVCTDETLLALLRGQRAVLETGISPEQILHLVQILPLVDLSESLIGKPKMRDKIAARGVLATFSAAVTVLKKDRLVDDVIAEVATPNGINRKELKNFRNRLNRGRAHWRDENNYQIALAYMESMTRAEIMSLLATVSGVFVPKPPL
jgi:hypothetical protein